MIILIFLSLLQWHLCLSSSSPLHQNLVPMQVNTCKLTSILSQVILFVPWVQSNCYIACNGFTLQCLITSLKLAGVVFKSNDEPGMCVCLAVVGQWGLHSISEWWCRSFWSMCSTGLSLPSSSHLFATKIGTILCQSTTVKVKRVGYLRDNSSW